METLSASKTIETMSPTEVGRVRYKSPPPLAAIEDGIFDVILFPNRSLPPIGFGLVMGVVIVVNLCLGAYFTTLGAWPVLGFCGIDILLVWGAFKLSYRQGRLHERIRIADDMLSVSRVLPSGHESRWRLQPYWTQVHIDAPGEHHCRVRLVSKGRALLIGSFLSPDERIDLGAAIKGALDRARRGSAPAAGPSDQAQQK